MSEVTVAYREPRPWWSVALASTLARVGGAAVVLGAVALLAFLGWGILDSGESDEVPQGRLEEVLQAITSAVSREEQILHTSFSAGQQDVEQGGTFTAEMWVDGEQGAVRLQWTPVSSEGSGATPSETTVIIADGYGYVRTSTGAAILEEAPDCQGVELWLATFLFLCEQGSELRVEDDTWEGEPAIVLVSERSVVIPGPDPNLVTPRATEQTEPISTPPGGVPTEDFGGIRTIVSRLYLDHLTYLPIARTSQETRNGEPENEFGDDQLNYEHEFLPRTDDLLALFDPGSIGYSGEE